jgi:hypothetical protein
MSTSANAGTSLPPTLPLGSPVPLSLHIDGSEKIVFLYIHLANVNH